jgi:hypothetical protein
MNQGCLLDWLTNAISAEATVLAKSALISGTSTIQFIANHQENIGAKLCQLGQICPIFPFIGISLQIFFWAIFGTIGTIWHRFLFTSFVDSLHIVLFLLVEWNDIEESNKIQLRGSYEAQGNKSWYILFVTIISANKRARSCSLTIEIM